MGNNEWQTSYANTFVFTKKHTNNLPKMLGSLESSESEKLKRININKEVVLYVELKVEKS